MVILLQDNKGKGILRKSCCSVVGRRFPIGNAYSYTVKRGHSSLCIWMTSNWLERNKTLIRCGKYSIKKLIWENQHLSLIMDTWAVLTDKCEISEDIVDNYRTMSESRISAGRTEKLPYAENFRISSWSFDMEGHAMKCVERYCELANKATQQLYKVSTPDDSGAFAVITEEGSSASKMTAAKVMDVIARLPDVDGQAADVVSACTQWKLVDAPRLLRMPKSECPYIYGHAFHDKWPKSWANIEDRAVPLERNLYWHPLAGLFVGRQFEEVSLELGWEKRVELGMSICSSKAPIILMGIRRTKMAGKKLNMSHMWKKLMTNVDLDELTSLLDHVYLGCTQRECKPNEIVEENTKDVWITFSCLSNWKVTWVGKLHARNSSVVLRCERHPKKYLKEIVNWYIRK